MIPALVSPVYTQVFVDRFLVQGASEWVAPLLVAMLLTAALIGFLTWLQQTYLLRLQVKLSVTTSSRFLWHVLRLPVQFFSQRYAGEIGSRVALNDLVATLLSGQLATTVITIMTLVFYLVMMALYSTPLTLVGIVVAALNLVALRSVSRRRADANRRLLQEYGKLIGTTMAGLQMIETVKAGGMEDDFFARFGGHQAAVVDATQSLGVKTQFLNAVPVFLTQFNALIMLTWGAWLIIDGSLTVGMLAAFMALAAAFIAPFATLVTLGATVQEAHGDMNRLDDVLKAPLDPVMTPAAGGSAAGGSEVGGPRPAAEAIGRALTPPRQAPPPPAAPSWRATSRSAVSPSATARSRTRSSATSTSPSARAGASRSWAGRAAARPPSPTWCAGSTSRGRETSCSTARPGRRSPGTSWSAPCRA